MMAGIDDRVLQGIANEIMDEERGPEAFAPRSQRLPDYVEHAEGVNQVGALMAEATVSQYEAVIQSVGAMVEAMKGVESRCEEVKAEALEQIERLQDWTTEIKERAKRAFESIQSEAMLLAEVKAAVEDLQKKTAG